MPCLSQAILSHSLCSSHPRWQRRVLLDQELVTKFHLEVAARREKEHLAHALGDGGLGIDQLNDENALLNR